MRCMVNRALVMVGVLLFLGLAGGTQAQAQMCVKYARSLTNFNIRGDAWTWWQGASGRYERSNRPAVGSVMVFKRTGQMPRGHVSVVSRVVNNRVVRVDHSWIDGDGLVRGMRVVDISPRNDWSNVRVWHPRTDSLGMRTYPTFGFIHPSRERGDVVMANLDDDLIDAVRHPGAVRSDGSEERFVMGKPLMPRNASDRRAPVRSFDLRGDLRGVAAEPEIVLPRRKPGDLLSVEAKPARNDTKPARTVAARVVPVAKPAAGTVVAEAVTPKRKPIPQVAALPGDTAHR